MSFTYIFRLIISGKALKTGQTPHIYALLVKKEVLAVISKNMKKDLKRGGKWVTMNPSGGKW